MKIVKFGILIISFASCTAAMSNRLVVVSGGNRGVGIGICRQVLACDPKAEVLVTARDLKQAEAVRDKLNQDFQSRAQAHQLDVTQDESCEALAKSLATNGDRPLSLVNNAGVGLDLPWFPSPWQAEVASNTLNVNLYGAERLTRALIPHLTKSSDGRVINVSSGGGRANMSKMSESNRKKLLDESVTWDDILAMSSTFVKEYEAAATAAINDPNGSEQLPFLSPSGFWLQSYGFSKACLGSYTQILARKYPTLLAIACSPGFIATDMSKTYPKYDTLKTIDEGGEYVAKLAIGNREELESGVFYQPEKGIVSFVAD